MVNIIPSSISSQFKSSGADASSGPKGNTLTVSDKTTLKDLQAFLAQGKASQEVRGHMVGGSLVLYTKPANPKDPGGRMQTALNHLVSNSAEQKRGLGKAGVETILKQHMGAERAATSSVTMALDKGVKSAVKVGSMTVLAEIARFKPMDQGEPSNPGPALHDTGMSKEQISHSVGEAAKLFKAGDADGAIKMLGRDFAEAFQKTNPDQNKRDAFALSVGKTFKQEISALLREHQVPEPPGGKDRHQTLADKIYAAVGSQVGHSKINDNGELVIGAKTYVKQGNLGEGGNGKVDLYVNKNDPADRLAFKTMLASKSGPDWEKKNMLLEIENHQKAYARDPDTVVPMRAGVQLPDGFFGLAMDVAPLGDMESAIKVLQDAEKKGDLTPTQSMAARLTLLQDGLKGLQILHEAGYAHRDVKPENLFIFAGGVAKVADLGDNRTIANYNIYDVGGQTPAYIGPERDVAIGVGKSADESVTKMRANELRSALQKADHPALQGGVSPMHAAASQMLAEQLPKLTPDLQKKLLLDLKQTVKQDAVSAVIDPKQRDAFAIGTTAFQLGRGELPSEGWDAKPDAVLSKDSTVTFTAYWIKDPALKSAVQELIKMADDLTNPDLAKRIDVAAALKSPAFNLDGIGTPETRTLIDTLLKRAKNVGDDYLPLPTPPPNTTAGTTQPQGTQTI
ncbi:MAG: protein kinase domain-containing protein [Allorhizobium sp.]